MKLARFAVAAAAILAATLCLAESFRSHSAGGMWYGKYVWARFTDETFVDQPTWSLIQTSEPPLKASQACKIATAYVAETKADQLTYAIESVAVTRYFDTDYWFYNVHFESVVESGDDSWQALEPYRTLLAQGVYPPSTNVPPRLNVFILMSGEVMNLEEM
ncbi:MAG: hypothetical protein K9N51_13120 [Candidatus Pacebacteria bacterium]|nr:hypothetical protein [Candidatus Paceibacterota bacterium]